jgi:microcystin-dependent protein
MANLTPWIRPQFFDDNGDPLAGGKLYCYAAGTSTFQATYTTAAGSVENANPVILDSNGRAPVYLSSSSYKFVLKDSNDVTIWTEDNVSLPVAANGFSTGDVKLTIKTTADSGWVLMDDTTIGSSASGASGRANDDTEALYTLLWNNTVNADCAVSTGRGASAAADFAANKTIALPKTLGRALAVYGSGSGLTARAMAAVFGAETHALSADENGTHTHVQDAHTHTQTAHGHALRSAEGTQTFLESASARGLVAGDVDKGIYQTNNGQSNPYVQTTTAVNQNSTAVNQNSGLGTAHNNMQPSIFLNVMIKL